MLFLKTFKDAKFVVDGNAFQTNASCTSRFKQFILMTSSVSTQCKEIIEIYIY